MNSDVFDSRDEAPTVEVRVWRHGELVARELCESEEQATAVVGAWAEIDGTECEVGDLSRHHRTAGLAEVDPETEPEPEPTGPPEDDYLEALKQAGWDARARRFD